MFMISVLLINSYGYDCVYYQYLKKKFLVYIKYNKYYIFENIENFKNKN